MLEQQIEEIRNIVLNLQQILVDAQAGNNALFVRSCTSCTQDSCNKTISDAPSTAA